MIVCKTSIGYGAGVKQDSESSHGAALGSEVLSELRQNLSWPYEPFELDEEIYQHWDARPAGKAKEKKWNSICEQLKTEDPQKYDVLKRLSTNKLPDQFNLKFDVFIKELTQNENSLATRKSSQIVLEFLQSNLLSLIHI